MTVTTGPTPSVEDGKPAAGRGGWVVAAGFALVVGLAVGWLIGGSDGDRTDEVVRADGAALTEEDLEMAAMLGEYTDAMRTGDYEAPMALLAGSIVSESGFEIAAADLTPTFFQDQMRFDGVFGTEVVAEDTVVFFSRNDDETFVHVVRFGDFSRGERHIEQHLIASA